jgi:hypothetical protein
MNALAILTDARDHGIQVTVDGDKLILEGDITPEMVATFTANKPEILRLLMAVSAADESRAIHPTMASEDPMNRALGAPCDDCGRPTSIALVTDYGSRYCRDCVFPSETAPKAQRGAQ